MPLLQSYKKVFLWLVLLAVLYFVLRLYHLDSLPIFTDEAIYMRWAQIAANDASWRFISLTDGKQPSFIWATLVAMQFITDPLIAGRTVSVLAGFMTMIGLFFLGSELFKNKWVGLVASALYVVFPMAFVYDRMALYDSLVGAFCVWGLYIELLLIRYIRLDIALILGLVLGGGMLTKTNAFLTGAFLPITLLFFDWYKKEKIKRLLTWGMLAGTALVLGYAYYSILRLSPFFYIIDQKNHEFVLPLSEWIKDPFIYFSGNMPAMLLWIMTYLTIPILGLVCVGILWGRKHVLAIIFILLWLIIPLTYQAFVGKIIYPRYIFFMVLPLLILAAYALVTLREKIRNVWIYGFLVIGILGWPVYIDYKILQDFTNAPIPKGEIDQYVNGWSAGGGVTQAIYFFQEESKDKKIYVATQGTFGLMPYALELYLGNNPNIIVQGFWPIDDTTLPEKVIAATIKMPTYFLFYQPCPKCVASGIAPEALPLEKVLQVEKDKNNSYLTVYKVTKN